MAVALPIISAVAGIAGAGYSAYASRQQGKTAEALAQYNAHQQEFNAKMQLMSMQAEAALQKRMAQAQYLLRQGEANAHFANAQVLEQTAEARSRVVRENIRRKAAEMERGAAATRAAFGSAHIVQATGTGADLVSYMAELMQKERETELYPDELNRRSLFREADLERLGGRMALAGATLERDSALAEAGLRAATGQAAYGRGLHEAEIMRLSGAAQRQRYNAEGVGTLFSGISSAAGNYAYAIS